jgi:hypothetical protein
VGPRGPRGRWWMVESMRAGFRELEERHERAFSEGDYGKALALSREMIDLVEPLHCEALYRAARATCLLGRKEEAYQLLKRAVEAGYGDVQALRSEKSFHEIQEDERFAGIVRMAWVRAYTRMLEREERADFQMKEEILSTLAFRPGERVADVGAGSGYFTLPVARAVAPGGAVLAIDIFQEMLDYIDERVRWEKIDNVRLQKVTREDRCFLPEGSTPSFLWTPSITLPIGRPSPAGSVPAWPPAAGSS